VLAALLAEDGDEQVGGAVRDCRLVAELGHRVDEHEQLDHLLHPVEVADLLLDGREHVQHHELRRLPALVDVEVATELPDERGLAVAEGAVPRDEEQIADADGADVVGDGGRRLGQLEAELA
jgi:hypothetical protein